METLIYPLHPENFKREVLEEERPVLVLCMPVDDRFPEQLKIVEGIAKSHNPGLKVGVIQEDFLEAFKNDYAVSGTPTFLLLIKGREKGRHLGLADPMELEALLEGRIEPFPSHSPASEKYQGEERAYDSAETGKGKPEYLI
jgi:hypothetical protein